MAAGARLPRAAAATRDAIQGSVIPAIFFAGLCAPADEIAKV
jgi:hypothetical protein